MPAYGLRTDADLFSGDNDEDSTIGDDMSAATMYLLVRRHKTSIFLQVHEDCPVLEVKKRVQGITGVEAADMQLYVNLDESLPLDNDNLPVQHYHQYNTSIGDPLKLAVVFRDSDGKWEPIEVTAMTSAPQMPAAYAPSYTVPEQEAGEEEGAETGTAIQGLTLSSPGSGPGPATPDKIRQRQMSTDDGKSAETS